MSRYGIPNPKPNSEPKANPTVRQPQPLTLRYPTVLPPPFRYEKIHYKIDPESKTFITLHLIIAGTGTAAQV